MYLLVEPGPQEDTPQFLCAGPEVAPRVAPEFATVWFPSQGLFVLLWFK